jgi:hypothetical protein
MRDAEYAKILSKKQDKNLQEFWLLFFILLIHLNADELQPQRLHADQKTLRA